MQELNQEWYPSEEYLTNIKKVIDRLLDNNTPHEYFYYEGAGRTVVIIDKVAVKIPEYNEEVRVD